MSESPDRPNRDTSPGDLPPLPRPPIMPEQTIESNAVDYLAKSDSSARGLPLASDSTGPAPPRGKRGPAPPPGQKAPSWETAVPSRPLFPMEQTLESAGVDYLARSDSSSRRLPVAESIAGPPAAPVSPPQAPSPPSRPLFPLEQTIDSTGVDHLAQSDSSIPRKAPAPGGSGAIPPQARPSWLSSASSLVPPATRPPASPPATNTVEVADSLSSRAAGPPARTPGPAQAGPPPPRGGSFGPEQTLEGAGVDIMARSDSSAHAGVQGPEVPGYSLDEKLGSGTFGEVWSAVQKSTGQRVAVKVLFARSEASLRTMQREVSRLASVAEHPHVVTVLDANLTHRPPFLVTPLLAGGSLQGKKGVPVPKAATWFEQMARALQYVHGKGVIHCDLKRANVLLDDEDAVRIVDFGQARSTGEHSASLGTLFYMPPEQAVLADPGVDVAPDVSWDVYALGATMYAVLTDTLPRASEGCMSSLGTMTDTGRVLTSYRDLLEKAPLVPLRTANKAVDPELAYIIEHCLELDPDRRYQSMGEVVDDLERRRARLPLRARPRTMRYVVGTFVRRHAIPVTLAAVFLTVLTTMGIINYRHVVAARNEAVRTLAAMEYQTGTRLAIEGHPASVLMLARAAVDVPSTAYAAPATWQVASTAPVSLVLKPGGLEARPEKTRSGLAFSADGSLLATAGVDSNATLWNVATGERIGSPLKHDDFVGIVAFNPHGTKLATGSKDGTARLWDSKGTSLCAPLQHGARVDALAWSPDGTQVATGGGNRARRWDPATGKEVGSLLSMPDEIVAVEYSPDGRTLMVASRDGRVATWDVSTGKAGPTFTATEALAFARWCDGGKRIVAAGYFGAMSVWRVQDHHLEGTLPFTTGQQVISVSIARDGRVIRALIDGNVSVQGLPPLPSLVLKHSRSLIRGAVCSDDNKRILSVAFDGTARLWDAAHGTALGPPLAHSGPVLGGIFSPDGRQIATLGNDGQVRVWDIERAGAATRRTLDLPMPGIRQSVSAMRGDGKVVATGAGNDVTLWDTSTGQRMIPPMVHPARVQSVTFTQEGQEIVTLCADRNARRWRLSDGTLLQTHPLPSDAVAINGKGDRMAAAHPDGRVEIRDTAGFRPVGAVIKERPGVRRLYYNGDGRYLVMQGACVSLWETGTPRRVIADMGPEVERVNFSRDSKRVLLLHWEAQVWDIESGKPLGPVLSYQAGTGGFSPDGNQVVLSTGDRWVRVFDVASGGIVGPMMGLGDRGVFASFSPDGKFIITSSGDSTVRLWDSRTHEALTPPLAASGNVSRPLMTRWGEGLCLLATTSEGCRIWSITLEKPASPERLLVESEARTGLTIDKSGDVRSLTPEEFQERQAHLKRLQDKAGH